MKQKLKLLMEKKDNMKWIALIAVLIMVFAPIAINEVAMEKKVAKENEEKPVVSHGEYVPAGNSYTVTNGMVEDNSIEDTEEQEVIEETVEEEGTKILDKDFIDLESVEPVESVEPEEYGFDDFLEMYGFDNFELMPVVGPGDINKDSQRRFNAGKSAEDRRVKETMENLLNNMDHLTGDEALQYLIIAFTERQVKLDGYKKVYDMCYFEMNP